MKKMNKKGFTIVELVIVIAVIGILAAVLIPTFSGVVDSANKSNALSEASNSLKVILAELAEDGDVLGNATFLYVKNGKIAYTISYEDNRLGNVVEADKDSNISAGKYTLTNNTVAYAKSSNNIPDDLFTNGSYTLKKETASDIGTNIFILVADSTETADTTDTEPTTPDGE